jgi:Zn finger protein HypA/HybF involved in hydrogenase expression
MKELTEMYKNLSIYTVEFHVHKSCQIDENIKISRRVDEVEKFQRERAHLINFKSYLDLSDRVTKLENDKVNKNPYKYPYKCPNCHGSKHIMEEVEPRVLKMKMCPTCECKGIVWG